MTSKLVFGLEWFTFTQTILLSLCFALPKPDEKWISITRWNPEIYYFLGYVSQTIFPVIEIIIISVIFIIPDNDTYNLNAFLVFGLLVNLGIMAQFYAFQIKSFRKSYDYWV